MNKVVKKYCSYFLVVLLSICTILESVNIVHAESVQAINNYNVSQYDVKFDVVSSWGNSYSMNVEITNNSNVTIDNWSLQFYSQDKIESMWNAQVIDEEDSVWRIANVSWNKEIKPNETISFGYIGTYNDKYTEPESVTLIYDDCTEKIIFNDPQYDVKFEIKCSWNKSYCMDVEITNNGDTPINDWILIYDSQDKIDTIWNAEVTYIEDSLCYLSNAGWNKEIKPGETRTFGYIGTYGENYSVPENAMIFDNECIEQELPDYELIDCEETEYGTVYYVEKNSDIQTYTLWDVVDIIMAGSSWAELFSNPSLGNFGWAVLDTAAILPMLPSSAYVRKGGKTFVKSTEVAKYAKTSAGKKVVESALKGYKHSDGISSAAIKAIKKQFKGKEGQKVLNLFKAAANKGLVGATGQAGIKKLIGLKYNKYTHEIKIKSARYGTYRIFGYRKENGQWVFDRFENAHN